METPIIFIEQPIVRTWIINRQTCSVGLSAVWTTTYKGATYKLYPKTTLGVILVARWMWWLRCEQNEERGQYEIRKKVRSDAFREITCDKVDPKVVATYIDYIAHQEERKKRAAADKIFNDNERRFAGNNIQTRSFDIGF